MTTVKGTHAHGAGWHRAHHGKAVPIGSAAGRGQAQEQPGPWQQKTRQKTQRDVRGDGVADCPCTDAETAKREGAYLRPGAYACARRACSLGNARRENLSVQTVAETCQLHNRRNERRKETYYCRSAQVWGACDYVRARVMSLCARSAGLGGFQSRMHTTRTSPRKNADVALGRVRARNVCARMSSRRARILRVWELRRAQTEAERGESVAEGRRTCVETTPGVHGPETRNVCVPGPSDSEPAMPGALEDAGDEGGGGETEGAASEDEARTYGRHLRLGVRDACTYACDELLCLVYTCCGDFRGRRRC